MSQSKYSQSTQQVQTQQQVLSPQQVLVARLTELPVEGLRDRINKELEDNHWLEKRDGAGGAPPAAPASDGSTAVAHEDSFGEGDDDYVPRAMNGGGEAVHKEPADVGGTFFDHLVAQLPEYRLNGHQTEVVRYIIGSLEEDGMLRTPLLQIQDELDIYQNVVTDEQELEYLLTHVVQQMEPAGVGGRNLRECLSLQVRRNVSGDRRERLLTLFGRYWDDFSHTRWSRIQQAMKLSDAELQDLQRSVRRLTPRPGGSLGNEPQTTAATAVPDFLITLDDDGRLHLSLNEGDLPQLVLSRDADIAMDMPTVTKSDQEAVRYLKGQIASAQQFIDALAQRRRSMLLTMQAIVRLQLPFFMTGDEQQLKPMRLEDVSAMTKLDVSTTSRVSNSKYVQTPHGIFPLRWFYSGSLSQDGEEVSVRNVLSALKSLVEGEEKSAPLSDEKLTSLLQQQGFSVKRRTVAKYRTQLGIPESRLR